MTVEQTRPRLGSRRLDLSTPRGRSRRMRRALCLAAATLTAACVAVSASAAVPRILIFSGPPLHHQVVVSNWMTIFHVIEASAAGPAASREALRRRPSIRVAMFWGPGWNEFIASGHDPRTLRPARADQFGRFYPRYRGAPAVLDLPWAGRWPHRVPPQALRLLHHLGVPIAVT